MEALLRHASNKKKTAAAPVDMEALVRRPVKAPKSVEPDPIDMEALVRRPPPKPRETPPSDMEALLDAPRRASAEKQKLDAVERRRQAEDEARRRASNSGGGFYGEPAAPVEASLKDYTLYAMARNKGFEGSMQDYYEACLKPVAPPAPDMEALVRRNVQRPAAPPPVCMDSLVRRPTPPAPINANAKRNQQVKDLVESARKIEPHLVDGMRFNTRLHRFLDLRPTAWTTWGEDEAREIVQAASAQAEASRQLSLANAVKWAAECEQAYAKPPGFLDRFAQNAKPEFYRVRLEQSRDILIKVQDDLEAVQTRIKENLERLRIDALVLQVVTAKETDPSNQITATSRLKTLVQVQTTGAMILQGSESLAQTSATQAATVSSLLTVTIPNWIMALQNR